MSNRLFKQIIKGNEYGQKMFGYPSFTWNSLNTQNPTGGTSYNCVASVTEFKSELLNGGFVLDQMVTMTVTRYTISGKPLFPNDVIPQSQQIISFNNLNWRIETVKPLPIFSSNTTNGPTFQLVAVSINRGI